MRIVFLGTVGYHPNEHRETTCLMLPEAGVVFDAGTGFFRVAEHLQTDELDIFLSHAHLDHVVGLTYFLVPILTGRCRAARLHGQPEKLEAVRDNLFSEHLFPIWPGYEMIPLADPITLRDGGVVTHRPLIHPGGSIGYRVDWADRSLAIITDTELNEGYLDFVRGVDLLVHECNFGDDRAEIARQYGHSSTSAVAELAARAGVGRLVLTHFDPTADNDDPIGIETARKIFPATELAYDKMEIEF